MNPSLEISLEEAIQLGAVDGSFYSEFWFPKTCRQATPEMHRTIWADLDDPIARYCCFMLHRDGAKTSLLRLFTSRRIAYGISHTILYTSNSEGHAVRSVEWIKRQVEFNTRWASAFGLRKGGKWSQGEIEIIHGVDEYPIYVLAVGITGQVRGVNLDDYRPDLVVGDDLDNEETTGTPEQREKARNLFFGALLNGLAPASEQPLAKGVLLQTPLAKGDLADTCARDPMFRTRVFGCFDERGESRWPDRYPTEVLKKEKAGYIARNQLALWMREKECRIVSEELSSFKLEWLKYWDQLPAGTWFTIAVDPAPSDTKGEDVDYFAAAVVGFHGPKVYIVDTFMERRVDPDAAVEQIFSWIYKYNPRNLVVETVAFQKMLSWYIKKQMRMHRKYVPIIEHDDKRSKADVILQGILSVAPHGNLHVKETQTDFLGQYLEWRPTNKKMHEDLLEAVARAIYAQHQDESVIDGEYTVDDETGGGSVKSLANWRSAP